MLRPARECAEDAKLFGLASPQALENFWFLQTAELLKSCPGVPRDLVMKKGELYHRLRHTSPDPRWQYVDVAQSYEKGILELNLEGMVRSFSSPFRRINPRVYFTRRKLRKLRNDHVLPNDVIPDLRKAIELKKAIEWTQIFLSKIPMADVPPEILDLAEGGSEAAPDLTALKQLFQNHLGLQSSLETYFETGYPKIEKIPFREAKFTTMLTYISSMEQRLDSIRDWQDYKKIEQDFANRNLQDLFQELISLKINPDELEPIIRKSFLQNWIDWSFSKQPILGQFRALQHEKIVREFRELDKLQWKLGPSQVLSEAVKYRPIPNDYVQSEAWVLHHEAMKKARHLPIRKLFPKISNLLPMLKPCLI